MRVAFERDNMGPGRRTTLYSPTARLFKLDRRGMQKGPSMCSIDHSVQFNFSYCFSTNHLDI
jgi:hypothetical protein